MFAIIKTGGKQYKVSANDVLKIERLEGEEGADVEFNEVLMIGEQEKAVIIGSPLVKGASVIAKVVSHVRDPKIIIFKKQRRQHYRRKNGHRQNVTHVLIKEIRRA